MAQICDTCTFLQDGWRCNRLVVNGGYGNNDRVAKDFMKDGKCDYYKQGPQSYRYGEGSCDYWNS